jgi:hypothetical protein
MTARKRFVVRRLTVADYAEYARLVERVRKKRESKDLVAARYHAFCKLNCLGVWTPKSVSLFIASVKTQLSPSTVVKHTLALKMLERERLRSPASVQLTELMKINQEDSAQKGVVHVVDFQDFDNAVLSVLAVKDRHIKAALACMLCLGLRYADLCRLTSLQIVIDLKVPSVEMDLKLTKNRRTPGKRVRVKLKRGSLTRFPEVLLKIIRTTFNCSLQPFKDLEWKDLRDHIRETCVEEAIKSRVTPGSLRRQFILKEIERHTHEDNNDKYVDWLAVTRSTSHCREDALIAYYQRSLEHL